MSAHPKEVYPQIVRVSYVEGDVRVSRGKDGEKATGAVWEKAEADLPLETGFSLVTGKGRAEIEFEDASTVYLGENSVLVCNELSATAGVPRTDLGLLSGVATLHVEPTFAGEWFILRTPTDTLSVRYPQQAFARVNSYLDAIAVTAQDDSTFHAPGAVVTRSLKGQTLTFEHGQRIFAERTPDLAASLEWDGWVMGRVEDRKAAMAAMMKESGLAEPILGLAEMQGQGRFFACEPYGTCWEPTKGWTDKETGAEQAEQRAEVGTPPRSAEKSSARRMELVDAPEVTASPARSGGAALRMAVQTYPAAQADPVAQIDPAALQVGPLVGPAGPYLFTEDDWFPCSPWQVRYLVAMDPLTRQERIVGSEGYYDNYPWDWAVCHTGSWINRNHRWAWVAGRKRHHQRPLRWVKYAGKKGYVPLHPRDLPGKPPINLKHGLYVEEKNGGVERVAFDAERPVKVLDEAPKEFRKAYFPGLPRAEAPRMEARDLGYRGTAAREIAGKGLAGRPAEAPITFDRKTQSFSMARQVTEGGKTTMMTQAFGGAQTRGGGGFGGGAGRTGGGSGGGFSRGSSGGGGGGRSSSGGGGGESHSASGGGGGAASSGGGSAGSHK